MDEKIKIIIVDDETGYREKLAERLRKKSFDVTSASSGEQAIEAAREQVFDLALVDIRMPGMSGERVLEALKNEHPFIEVIILTGYGSIESAVHCTQIGSYSYLQKPFQMQELLEVLKSAYQNRLQSKMKLDRDKIENLAQIAIGESPIGILKKLKQLDKARS